MLDSSCKIACIPSINQHTIFHQHTHTTPYPEHSGLSATTAGVPRRLGPCRPGEGPRLQRSPPERGSQGCGWEGQGISGDGGYYSVLHLLLFVVRTRVGALITPWFSTVFLARMFTVFWCFFLRFSGVVWFGAGSVRAFSGSPGRSFVLCSAMLCSALLYR